ncbi:MAG: hypothetical protein KatS3mg006_1039 [Pyrinomonadaceae bacterium]|nr:MAG: hypothetical protein KatS3mg006_1039 [Pyrinomonadaceae bacterium]
MAENPIQENPKDNESVESIRKQLEEMNQAGSGHTKKTVSKRKTSGSTGTAKRRTAKGGKVVKRASNPERRRKVEELSKRKDEVNRAGILEGEVSPADLGAEAKGIQNNAEELPSFLVENDESKKNLFSSLLSWRRKEEATLQQEESQEFTSANSIRNAGLAWSAAIGLFGSIVFMMAIGWIMDTLLGSEPVGIVVGIILGAAIGFYQFFRIMSKISE